MSEEKMMDSEREYRDRFFVSTKDSEPELGRYCVVNFGAYTYEVGMFIDTPWEEMKKTIVKAVEAYQR